MTTRYTRDHEWIRLDGDVAVVGITDYAQEQLGDIVFVELPEVGKTAREGRRGGVVELVKAASEVFAPISGEVTEVNDALGDEPGAVNESPEGTGWLIKLKPANKADLDGLMDAAAYAAYPRDDLTAMAGHLYRATVTWRRERRGIREGPLLARPYAGASTAASRCRPRPRRRSCRSPLRPRPRSIPRRRSSPRSPRATCSPSSISPAAPGSSSTSYEDDAEGVMEKNAAGRYWISRVTLRPRIAYAGDKQPSHDDLARLHHAAHEECFIANSVKTDVNGAKASDALSPPYRRRPRRRCSRKIGVGSIDDLFADIPAGKRVAGLLDLPTTKSEIEVERHLGRLAARNVAGRVGAVLRRRRRLPPPRAGERRPPDPALRVPDLLHALPAGDAARARCSISSSSRPRSRT